MKRGLVMWAVLGLAGFVFLGAGAEISVESMPPVVVETAPRAGAVDVDPAIREIRIVFSKKMMTDRMWSVVQVSDDSFPPITGPVHFLADQKTFVIPVKLEPAATYALWFNSQQFDNFKDLTGHPAVPYLLVFRTGT
jgi:hypothetical protein